MSDSLPVFIQALSGNTSDKNHFREIVQAYGQSLQERRQDMDMGQRGIFGEEPESDF